MVFLFVHLAHTAARAATATFVLTDGSFALASEKQQSTQMMDRVIIVVNLCWFYFW